MEKSGRNKGGKRMYIKRKIKLYISRFSIDFEVVEAIEELFGLKVEIIGFSLTRKSNRTRIMSFQKYLSI